MSETMPERPATGRRRPKPASDVNVDPIDPIAPQFPVETPSARTAKTPRVPVSTRLDEETIYILNRVKLDERVKIYEAIELAVKEKWGSYGSKK